MIDPEGRRVRARRARPARASAVRPRESRSSAHGRTHRVIEVLPDEAALGAVIADEFGALPGCTAC
jgi:hypothetical protein